MVALLECLWIADYFLTGPVSVPHFFPVLTFNVKYKFPMVFTFILSVHQFAGLKCSLESCPGLYLRKLFTDTCDRCSVFKNQLKTPITAAQGAHCQFHWTANGSSEKTGVDRGGRNPARTSPSLDSEENRHICMLEGAIVTEVKVRCLFTALGKLPVPVTQTNSSFLRQ